MYDSLNELQEKIRLGEDSTIEFKRELASRKDKLADEIAAFANAKGGVLLIGVDDSGHIIGLIPSGMDANEKLVTGLCNDSIKPALNLFTQKLILDDKCVLKIDVPRSSFVHKSPGGYFTRRGSSKRELPSEELARLLQARSQANVISFDKQFVMNTSMSTLEFEFYRSFISCEDKEDDKKTENMLRKRSLLVPDGEIIRASVAGVLMCCANPTDYLSNAFIQAVYYRGQRRDANYQIDAHDFTGTLNQQIMDAFKFVEKHNQVSATKKVGRVDHYQYSMRAVFEALVNAVVHRDYAKHASKIRLHMFSDRLEICSPGALANTLTVDTLQWEQATRNELLARLLSELTLEERIGKRVNRKHFLERRGEGVGIIFQECTQLCAKAPIYEMHGEELYLTIYAADTGI